MLGPLKWLPLALAVLALVLPRPGQAMSERALEALLEVEVEGEILASLLQVDPIPLAMSKGEVRALGRRHSLPAAVAPLLLDPPPPSRISLEDQEPRMLNEEVRDIAGRWRAGDGGSIDDSQHLEQFARRATNLAMFQATTGFHVEYAAEQADEALNSHCVARGGESREQAKERLGEVLKTWDTVRDLAEGFAGRLLLYKVSEVTRLASLDVYVMWEDEVVVHPTVSLLRLWDGALAHCLGQDRFALKSLQAFLRDSEGQPGFEDLVLQARVLLVRVALDLAPRKRRTHLLHPDHKALGRGPLRPEEGTPAERLDAGLRLGCTDRGYYSAQLGVRSRHERSVEHWLQEESSNLRRGKQTEKAVDSKQLILDRQGLLIPGEHEVLGLHSTSLARAMRDIGIAREVNHSLGGPDGDTPATLVRQALVAECMGQPHLAEPLFDAAIDSLEGKRGSKGAVRAIQAHLDAR